METTREKWGDSATTIPPSVAPSLAAPKPAKAVLIDVEADLLNEEFCAASEPRGSGHRGKPLDLVYWDWTEIKGPGLGVLAHFPSVEGT